MTMYPGRTEQEQRLRQAFDEQREAAIELARWLHAHPEPVGQEVAAAQRVTSFLAERGFEIETQLAGMTAAFQARSFHWDTEAMRKGLRHAHVGFVADLGAAPEGNVRGNHLNVAASVLAATALATSLPPKLYGTVSVFGCPGPELFGGKLRIAEAGYFEAADEVYGVVPALSAQGFPPTIDSSGKTFAQALVTVRYPSGDELAMGELQQAVAALLDGLQPGERIWATQEGFGIEAPQAQGVRALYEQIAKLAETRARSGGAVVEVELTALANDMNPNRILARRAKTFADSSKVPMDRLVKSPHGPATDWGAISYSSAVLRWPISISDEHTAAYDARFAELSNRAEAYERIIPFAYIVAELAMDVMADIELRGFVENDFVRGLKERGVNRIHRRWTGVHPVQPESVEARQRKRPEPGGLVRGPGLNPDQPRDS
jgi:metal-dependent amidase/aminoacylase/carboxypeptidase family protein